MLEKLSKVVEKANARLELFIFENGTQSDMFLDH